MLIVRSERFSCFPLLHLEGATGFASRPFLFLAIHLYKNVFLEDNMHNLHRKQTIAFTSQATEILYGGACGGGKSHLMRVKAIQYAMCIPNCKIYLIRRKGTDLIENHVDGETGFNGMLAELLDDGHVKWNQSKMRFNFWNGSFIKLGHCQHEKDKTDYQGKEIHLLLIDELTHFTESIYRYLRGRCRASESVVNPHNLPLPMILCGSNPGGVGHNWVKHSFVDTCGLRLEPLQMPREEGGKLRQYIPATLDDNPSLDEEEYMDTLSGVGSAEMVKALRDGSWDIAEGAMFADVWDARKHLVEPFQIPKTWRIDRTFDWGGTKPFAVPYFAESDGSVYIDSNGNEVHTIKGDLFIIQEYYGWNGKPDEGLNMLNADIGREVLEYDKAIKSQYGIKVRPGAADGAIFHNSNGTGKSMYDDFRKVGCFWTDNADKSPGSRVTGAQKLREYLVNATKYPREEPGIFIFNTTRQFPRTIPVLPRDPKKPNDVDTNAEDHYYDAVRYKILQKPVVTKAGWL